MNNRERRIRERYQQRQAEAQRHRSPTSSDDCQVEAYEGISSTLLTIDDGIEIAQNWVAACYPEGPGLRQWLRVKDDWTDLDAFVQKCRQYGFPETHPYGKLKEACPIVFFIGGGNERSTTNRNQI